ncbi:hypothetical protein Poli38472_004609 [Pythium oligandrum]|uniref:DNA repair protein RAD51 homolog 3 n=1 Tax=Pythium oligandrum TaxID=41045 RepID=A0A8K1CB29_PYTOL|nr:hypothetical protein Poli38472_004609 [Pythium oligandrum]|eukprot:TMW59540.1 hypothetical protein Poli38472_004609 [Pythium oligandrum]
MELADVELAACGLAPSALALLYKAGFRYKADVHGLSARDLANETGLSAKDAAVVVRVVDTMPKEDAPPPSAYDLLQELRRSRSSISTHLPGLDQVLGGGLSRSEVTEICGTPGTGKTQLSLHLCLAAQFDPAHPDERTSTIFIDTEGSFVIERVASMAESLVTTNAAFRAHGITRDDLLRGISYFRAHDFVELAEIIQSLSDLISSKPDVGLILIDSVAFHFRHGFEDYAQRIRAMDALSAQLQQLTVDTGVAVVLINQMTSKATLGLRSGAMYAPALGDNWAHSVTNRIQLSWESNSRVARVIKSSALAQGAAYFEVMESGVQVTESSEETMR